MTRLDEVAAALLAAAQSHHPFVAGTANAQIFLEEAYAIQDAVAQARPACVRCLEGGHSARLEPTATPLFTVFDSPAIWTARQSWS